MIDKIKILQIQIHNDMQDIIGAFETGEIDWDGIIKALDRLVEKQKRFNQLVENLIGEAEAQAEAGVIDLRGKGWEKEKEKVI